VTDDAIAFGLRDASAVANESHAIKLRQTNL
ncbi:MAG: hypothetical protein JWR83_1486, partial [Aeromicrobium sp.]|nr:hypothetical protein [Aeromicrobium sp.]